MPHSACLSILDLVRVTEGSGCAMRWTIARDLAAHAEQWGYWGKQTFAEIGCKWAS